MIVCCSWSDSVWSAGSWPTRVFLSPQCPGFLFLITAAIDPWKVTSFASQRSVAIFFHSSPLCELPALNWYAFINNISLRIHPMQIWRTTPSSPGTSCMKARLVGPRCFVLTSFLGKVLLRSRSRLVYFVMSTSMPPEGSEIFDRKESFF